MEETINKEIQKGFNAGYQLQKHKPQLAEKLKRSLQGNDEGYAIGFLKG